MNKFLFITISTHLVAERQEHHKISAPSREGSQPDHVLHLCLSKWAELSGGEFCELRFLSRDESPHHFTLQKLSESFYHLKTYSSNTYDISETEACRSIVVQQMSMR
jgi:hypothetical protein